MKIESLHRGALLAVATFLVVGCSANQLKEPVHTFSDAATVNAATVDKWESDYDTYAMSVAVDDAARHGDIVDFNGTQCKIGRNNDACALVSVRTHEALGAGGGGQAIRALATQVATYGKNLQAIVDATTVETFNASVDSLQASIDGLAKSAGSSSNAAAYTGVAGGIGKLVGNAILEKDRLDILRKYVPTADVYMQKLPDVMGKLVTGEKDVTLKKKASAIQSDVARYNVSHSGPGSTSDAEISERRSTLNALANEVSELRTFAEKDIGTGTRQVADAHHALALLVQNPGVDRETLIQQIKAAFAIVKDIHDDYDEVK